MMHPVTDAHIAPSTTEKNSFGSSRGNSDNAMTVVRSARRPFFARKEKFPRSGGRAFNGEDVALEPTTASCVKWRFGDKTGGFGSSETANRDEL